MKTPRGHGVAVRAWGTAVLLAGSACAPVSAPAALSLAAFPHPPTPTAVIVVAVIGATATPPVPGLTMTEADLPPERGWGGAAACPGPVAARAGDGTFAWPTDAHTLAGKGYAYDHPGLDLEAGFGASIYAADSGAVVYAGWNAQGYGMLVVLDHGNGWHTLYAHLSQINVACGEAVAQGALLGLAGSTGNSTGPHLHFEIRADGGRVNPWHYLP